MLFNIAMEKPLYMEVLMGKSWSNWSLIGGIPTPEKYESDWIIIPTIMEKIMFQTTNQIMC